MGRVLGALVGLTILAIAALWIFQPPFLYYIWRIPWWIAVPCVFAGVATIAIAIGKASSDNAPEPVLMGRRQNAAFITVSLLPAILFIVFSSWITNHGALGRAAFLLCGTFFAYAALSTQNWKRAKSRDI
jgi:hypothetical protein